LTEINVFRRVTTDLYSCFGKFAYFGLFVNVKRMTMESKVVGEGSLIFDVIGANEVGNGNLSPKQLWDRPLKVVLISVVERNGDLKMIANSRSLLGLDFTQRGETSQLGNHIEMGLKAAFRDRPIVGAVIRNAMIKKNRSWPLFLNRELSC
jgi:hypothetical protein